MAKMNELPNELLVQIFTTVRDSCVYEEEGVERMRWLRLAEVCHQWNAIVTTTPALWSILHFYDNASEAVFDSFLSRSQALSGLEVSLDFGRSTRPPSWMVAIHGSAHTQRISSLTLRWHRIQHPEVYTLIQKLRLPFLTFLHLDEDDARLVKPTPLAPVTVPVVVPYRSIFSDENQEHWGSDAEEVPLTEVTEDTTDGDGSGAYDSDNQAPIVNRLVFRAQAEASDSDWDSRSEKYTMHSPASNTDDSEYDGSSESVSEDDHSSEGDVSQDDQSGEDEASVQQYEEAFRGDYLFYSIREPDPSHHQPDVLDTDTDEDSDEDSEDEDNGPSGDELHAATDDEEEFDAPTYLLLPPFPSLTSLSLSGLVFVRIHPVSKLALHSLEILDTGKFMFTRGTPRNDCILDMLHRCTNLVQLTLEDFYPPASVPEDRAKVCLPNLRKLVLLDGLYVTEEFFKFLDLGTQCTSLRVEGLLDPLPWGDEPQDPDVGPPVVFQNAFPPLTEFTPATRPTIEAVLRPKCLTFRADNGFFVDGISEDNTSSHDIEWQLGLDASGDPDAPRRESKRDRKALSRALPVAIEEIGTRAIWRTDTVTDLQLHLAPCKEFMNALDDPFGGCLPGVVEAFLNLRRFAIGGEFAVRRYFATLTSMRRGWWGLEELALCLHRPSETCFEELSQLMHLLGRDELPQRLVVRLPTSSACASATDRDFRTLAHWHHPLEVKIIGQECATCQRPPPEVAVGKRKKKDLPLWAV